MRIPIIISILTLLCGARAIAGENSPLRGWDWRPSFYVFGSIDEIGKDAPAPIADLVEDSPALSLASSMDASWDGQRGRFQTSAFVLTRSPFTKGERSLFLAGRLHAVRELGADWRLTLDDSARYQRRDESSIMDFQRNEIVVGLEWRRPRGVNLGFRFSDRRRSLPNLAELGFERQGATVATSLSLGRRIGAELSLQWQRYSATTANGQRIVLSTEVARYSSRGAFALRGAWFEPAREGSTMAPDSVAGRFTPDDLASAPSPPQLVARIEGSETAVGLFPGSFEALALQESAVRDAADIAGGTDVDLTGDPFLFDPLESDSDEWDFGRRKQVLVAFASRRFADSWRGTVIVRYQHKSGPNLLLPNGSSGPWFKDDRLALRAAVKHRIHRRITFFVQGCHLHSWADRSELNFKRTLVALGMQARF
jgi:hypothetical protein